MKLVSSDETIRFFDDQYKAGSIRYGDLKKSLADDMVNYIKPIGEKIKELSANENLLREIIGDGGKRARDSASKTIREVREIIGLKSF